MLTRKKKSSITGMLLQMQTEIKPIELLFVFFCGHSPFCGLVNEKNKHTKVTERVCMEANNVITTTKPEPVL